MGYQNKFDYEIIGGVLPICQNATVQVCGAWIRIYYVLCSKTYSTLGGLFWIPAVSQQAIRGACICESGLLSKQVVFSRDNQISFIGM